MREMNPVHKYLIARCIVENNDRGEEHRVADYSHPREIDSRDNIIWSGHDVPESSH